jgi:aminoglycoside N3'-acetyltransferase
MRSPAVLTGEDHPTGSCTISSRKPDYCRTDLLEGLRLTGICPGDTVFFEVSNASLGQAECGPSEIALGNCLYSAMREAIGPEAEFVFRPSRVFPEPPGRCTISRPDPSDCGFGPSG